MQGTFFRPLKGVSILEGAGALGATGTGELSNSLLVNFLNEHS